MVTRTLFTRCAPLAIAASAALTSIPATAQDTVAAEPVIVLPAAAPEVPSAASTPSIVLPDLTVEPVASVANTAEPVAVATAAPVSRSAVSRSAPRAAAPSSARAPSPIDPAVPAAAIAAPTRVASPASDVPVGDPVAAAPTTSASTDATGEVGLAALLGALGLATVGGIAYAASRRRRRKPMREMAPVEPARLAEPAGMRTVEPLTTNVLNSPARATNAFATPVLGTIASPRLATPTDGDPIALPAAVPATFEERDALLKELVAAEPDRANPFTSPRARARRAKLIMQSLGRSFQSRKPRIDLSEYTHRWPALRGWQPATA